MKIYRPSDTCFDEMKRRMNRRALPEDSVRDTVNAIIQDVSARGDEALFDYASRFDKVHLDSSSLFVTEAELAEAEAMVEGSAKEAIGLPQAAPPRLSAFPARRPAPERCGAGQKVQLPLPPPPGAAVPAAAVYGIVFCSFQLLLTRKSKAA